MLVFSNFSEIFCAEYLEITSVKILTLKLDWKLSDSSCQGIKRQRWLSDITCWLASIQSGMFHNYLDFSSLTSNSHNCNGLRICRFGFLIWRLDCNRRDCEYGDLLYREANKDELTTQE